MDNLVSRFSHIKALISHFNYAPEDIPKSQEIEIDLISEQFTTVLSLFKDYYNITFDMSDVTFEEQWIISKDFIVVREDVFVTHKDNWYDQN